MKAVEIRDVDGARTLVPTEVPVPMLQPGEVRINVVAAGINRADVQQVKGVYPPPPGASELPGLEVSGTIAAVAPDVDIFHVGDEVVALLSGGGYAEQVTVPAGQVLHRPDNVELVDAAAIPEAVATVYSNIFMVADAQPGDTILIHGGAGGIGTTAIQVARALGLTVIATAGSPEKCQKCLDLGANLAINYRDQDFVEEVRAFTEGRGVDVVLDVIGAKYLERNISVLALGGRVVVVGLQGGATAELNLGTLMTKRASIIGTTLRSRPTEEKAEIMRQVREVVWPLIESGALVPQIDRTFPLDQAAQAHEYFNSGQHAGKVLLTV